jgi:sulfate transport system ATP-binding protein
VEITRVQNGVPGLEAMVLHISPAGSVAKVQLKVCSSGDLVQVDLSPSRYRELGLRSGDTAYLVPRKARVFTPDYAI